MGNAANNALPENSIARFILMTNRWEALGNGLRKSDGFLGVVNALALVRAVDFAQSRIEAENKAIMRINNALCSQ